MEHVRVRVPASCANLGPGFDALAVAIDMHLWAETTARAERRVIAAGDGADELPSDERNLVWRAFAAACAVFGAPTPDVSLRTRNAIPLERGMGSSAAAAVAGAALARGVTGVKVADQGLVDLAAALEGHPDNAAAAVLGGLVVCVGGSATRLQPSSALRPVLCVPAGRQSTEVARGMLPASVSLAAAAANGARAAAVLAGLCGAMALDPAAMTDVLHEPARLDAMPETGALVRRLREQGIAACLSGAGPSVLAVIGDGRGAGGHSASAPEKRTDETAQRVAALAGDGWRVLPQRWDLAGATAG